MEKINVAKLLKDCPKGMELDCALFDSDVKVLLDEVLEDDFGYPIKVIIKYNNIEYFKALTKYGTINNLPYAKCVIFPKGKTTWEGFVPPCQFKDGDIVYIKTKGHNHNEYIIIFKEIKNDHIHKYVCFAYQHLSINKCALCHLVDAEIMRFATEEEKQKLFDAIKANGYKWNDDKKELEKLIVPKFKVGDRIKWIKTGNIHEIIKILSNCYIANYLGADITILFDRQDEYELVPNKFDINTLKPFKSNVLVRGGDNLLWMPATFGFFNGGYFCVLGGNSYKQCIPYENNESLLGTTKDCDEYYKTWK